MLFCNATQLHAISVTRDRLALEQHVQPCYTSRLSFPQVLWHAW